MPLPFVAVSQTRNSANWTFVFERLNYVRGRGREVGRGRTVEIRFYRCAMRDRHYYTQWRVAWHARSRLSHGDLLFGTRCCLRAACQHTTFSSIRALSLAYTISIFSNKPDIKFHVHTGLRSPASKTFYFSGLSLTRKFSLPVNSPSRQLIHNVFLFSRSVITILSKKKF